MIADKWHQTLTVIDDDSGIFHLVGIKKFAIVLSVTTTEGTYAITGAPTVPSYVPGGFEFVPLLRIYFC